MTKAIKQANKEVLESPPDLISPKGLKEGPLIEIETNPEHEQLADYMTDFILASMLHEVKEEIPALVSRPSLLQ